MIFRLNKVAPARSTSTNVFWLTSSHVTAISDVSDKFNYENSGQIYPVNFASMIAFDDNMIIGFNMRKFTSIDNTQFPDGYIPAIAVNFLNSDLD